jgi:hypothetical protein
MFRTQTADSKQLGVTESVAWICRIAGPRELQLDGPSVAGVASWHVYDADLGDEAEFVCADWRIFISFNEAAEIRRFGVVVVAVDSAPEISRFTDVQAVISPFDEDSVYSLSLSWLDRIPLHIHRNRLYYTNSYVMVRQRSR